MEEKKYRWIFPHVKGTMTTAGMMRMMLLALLPAEIFGILHFGPRVLLHLLICIVTCTLTEFTYEAFRDKPLTVTDGSAMVTGVLLALMLPVNAPLWLGALGGIFAIGVVKMPFGGLGKNRLNPALSGYCLLFLAFPKYMKDYSFGSFGSQTLLGQLLSGQTVDPYPCSGEIPTAVSVRFQR
ncbi:MAG: RnfABCDGE type electron transport complex subunit D [Eubacteriales bacterium]